MFEDVLPERVKALLRRITPLASGEGFYLAGGTGLALQVGHRISGDLNFFRDTHFNADSLSSLLRTKTDPCEDLIVERQAVSAFVEGVRCSFSFCEVPLTFKPLSYEGLKVGWVFWNGLFLL